MWPEKLVTQCDQNSIADDRKTIIVTIMIYESCQTGMKKTLESVNEQSNGCLVAVST